MFEKLAEQFEQDVTMRYQQKLAELEKSANTGFGRELRKGISQLKNFYRGQGAGTIDLDASLPEELMKTISRLGQHSERQNNRAAQANAMFNSMRPGGLKAQGSKKLLKALRDVYMGEGTYQKVRKATSRKRDDIGFDVRRFLESENPDILNKALNIIPSEERMLGAFGQ